LKSIKRLKYNPTTDIVDRLFSLDESGQQSKAAASSVIRRQKEATAAAAFAMIWCDIIINHV